MLNKIPQYLLVATGVKTNQRFALSMIIVRNSPILGLLNTRTCNKCKELRSSFDNVTIQIASF